MLPESQKFEFGDFLLDTKEKVLLRNGKPVPITPKAFELLLALLANHGHLVEKNELINAVWAGSFVEEANLPFTIGLLRKALGDDAQKPAFIETVPKRGYRFIADVHRRQNGNSNAEAVQLPRPYVLAGLAIVLLLSFLVLSFVWFRGVKRTGSGQASTRVTTNGKVSVASISPDGRMLVYARKDESGESLWRRDLDNDAETLLLPSAATEFVGLAISPDSQYAYYSVFSENAVASNFSRVRLTGGEPEPLPEIASDISVSFSPDGERFVYTESHGAVKETSLKVANADGSEQRTLITAKGDGRAFPVFRSSPVAWSAENEIACAVQESDGESFFYRILLVDPDNGSERYLSDRRWDFIESLVWQDSENLAFTNLEPNTPGQQIWRISKDTGEARRLDPNLKDYMYLSAARGKLFAVERTVFSSLCTADLAEDLSKAQTTQIFNEPAYIEDIDWVDNKIFYNSWATGKNEIWYIDPLGTSPKQLTTDSFVSLGFTVSPADGTLVFSAKRKNVESLFVAEPDGRNIRQLTFGTSDVYPRFMPDGKNIIYEQRSLVSPTIWRVSIGGDRLPEQLTGYRAQEPSVSPDGKIIAYQFMDQVSGSRIWKIGLMDSASGKLINKIDLPLLITDRSVAWSPSGDMLTMAITTGASSDLLFQSPVDGSYRTIENVTRDKISSLAWSPDGTRLAFAVNQITSDAVLVDGR